MSTTDTIINTIKSEIVKYGRIETLKKFKESHCGLTSPNAGCFTRNRNMPLPELLRFILMPRTRSTEVELLEYSHITGSNRVNKSDFSRRRRQLPAGYFKSLHRDIIRDIYAKTDPAVWNGHLLLAGDGTTYSLPNTRAIRNKYLEGRKTGRGEQALARGVVLKDVLNDIVVSSNMESYGSDEISLLMEEIESLPVEVTALMPVVVLDRKYCAYTLLAALLRRGVGFVIRVKQRFNEAVDNFICSGDSVGDIILKPSPTTVKKLNRLYGKGAHNAFRVRLVRLSDSVVVMTSITDFPLFESERDIYHSRWDDETTIGFIKNNLQVEIFSGYSDVALQQDFYAKTIVYNILSILVGQAAELRHDRNPRRINRNIALGIFSVFVLEILPAGTDDCNTNFDSVLKEISRFSTHVIPNRHNARVFRNVKHSGKYITLNNYARAI